MRALRILLIFVVVIGGLFVAADRIAVHFAESKAADKIRTSEGLGQTPDVSINGFPFLTQIAGGTLDDVELGIQDFEAKSGKSDAGIRIADLKAEMHGVKFDSSYSSATADSATGTARIDYAELLKAVKKEGPAQVAPGVSAWIDGLAYGGDHKVKVTVAIKTPLGTVRPTVRSTVDVDGGKLSARADSLPDVSAFKLADGPLRGVTDFQQALDDLPAGIKLDRVQAVGQGIEITVKGSDLDLVG
ncbi:LmeA family phospholipid-binding protein [Streptomyces sp. NBC_00356]|uniref:LmeA family phospholipid-binding protein n=1 Tax=Streptomyces sp. NBC_00356 TaxID=2975724 RepID=UPI002E276AEC